MFYESQGRDQTFIINFATALKCMFHKTCEENILYIEGT
jgi:hypothetical protein